MYWFLLLIVILVVWTLWGAYSSHVEQAVYTVIQRTPQFEIREYAPHIEAQTTVHGDYREALGQGFRIIASYIFGNNTTKASVAMTAPVTATTAKSQNISMTAPVTATSNQDGHTIAFVMPASYTLETLPTPNDERVKIVSIPVKRFAVRTMRGWMNQARFKREEKALLESLARENISVAGESKYAGYNAPWTPPWLMRNEVLTQIV